MSQKDDMWKSSALGARAMYERVPGALEVYTDPAVPAVCGREQRVAQNVLPGGMA